LNWAGDGVEVAFRDAAPGRRGPVFVLWGTTDGRFQASACGGATGEQRARLEKETAFAVRAGKEEWTCEWRIPLAKLGLDAKPGTTLRFNLGMRCKAAGKWQTWAPTGGANWHVERAGILVFR
jgi:hypothetical protein